TLGFAALLSARSDLPEVARAGASILASTRRLTAIIEAVSLLDLGREPGRTKEPVSVDAAVRRALEAHREMLAARGIGAVLESTPLDRTPAIERMTVVDSRTLDQLLALILTWAVFRSPTRGDVRLAVDGLEGGVAVAIELSAPAQP